MSVGVSDAFLTVFNVFGSVSELSPCVLVSVRIVLNAFPLVNPNSKILNFRLLRESGDHWSLRATIWAGSRQNLQG